MTEAAPKHLWFVRTDKKNTKFFNEQISQGKLRQGWGHKPEHNLRLYAEHKDKKKLGGARLNLPMLKVKAGDWLVAVNLPSYGRCTVLKASEDFKTSYTYIPDPKLKDFGHCFDVQRLFDFSSRSSLVTSEFTKTRRTPGRFWNKKELIPGVYELYRISLGEKAHLLQTKNTELERLKDALFLGFNRDLFDSIKSNFSAELNKRLHAEQWEFALVEILGSLYPNYTVTREGGQAEKEHGTDILITIPNPMGDKNFLIAIQVKDYQGSTDEKPFIQINKAKKHFEQSEQGTLIETWVVLTGIDSKTVDIPANYEAKVMGQDELDELLLMYALSQANSAQFALYVD